MTATTTRARSSRALTARGWRPEAADSRGARSRTPTTTTSSTSTAAPRASASSEEIPMDVSSFSFQNNSCRQKEYAVSKKRFRNFWRIILVTGHRFFMSPQLKWCLHIPSVVKSRTHPAANGFQMTKFCTAHRHLNRGQRMIPKTLSRTTSQVCSWQLFKSFSKVAVPLFYWQKFSEAVRTLGTFRGEWTSTTTASSSTTSLCGGSVTEKSVTMGK